MDRNVSRLPRSWEVVFPFRHVRHFDETHLLSPASEAGILALPCRVCENRRTVVLGLPAGVGSGTCVCSIDLVAAAEDCGCLVAHVCLCSSKVRYDPFQISKRRCVGAVETTLVELCCCRCLSCGLRRTYGGRRVRIQCDMVAVGRCSLEHYCYSLLQS